MARKTIDFGIDLGTTNSVISVINGQDTQVFKNNNLSEITPSAVWIDRKNNLHVGQEAKNHVIDDEKNAFCEFKLQMGTDTEYLFERSGRKMKPEELSAEVLKSLKSDVKQMSGEEVISSVITVPAAFELSQCSATKKAGTLAGFKVNPLLQEPVAAALAYGFQSDKDKIYWFVYDFGGGTFDAAIIGIREGMIEVVNHGGDNHLGGKLIDWEIVEKLLIPAVVEQNPSLKNFSRGNDKWSSAIAKLKYHAELGKIALSQLNRDEKDITIDWLCNDENGEQISFVYELTRADVEKLIEPNVVRSINICRKVLAEAKLGTSNIEKIIMVGGTTLIPMVRDMLADPKVGLGISLDYSIDPLTVVAKGAAIFAATQRVEMEAEPAKPGEFVIYPLEYRTVTPIIEPPIGGVVTSGEEIDMKGFTIEFVNTTARPAWKSGKCDLDEDGSFNTFLWLEQGKINKFEIELLSQQGTKQKVNPDMIEIRPDIVMDKTILMQSVGISMADNSVDLLFQKGLELPASKPTTHRTVKELKKDQTDGLIEIPIVEGENRKADRNKFIGHLRIKSKEITRDLPVNSEVNIKLSIDEDRIITAEAYIPILDITIKEVLTFSKKTDLDELKREVDEEIERYNKIHTKARYTNEPKINEAIERIEKENMIDEVKSALNSAKTDRDAADKCENRLLDLRVAIDRIEELLEWPTLIEEAEKKIKMLNDVMNQYGQNEDKENARMLEADARKAMKDKEPGLLDLKMREIDQLVAKVMYSKPETWVHTFQQISKALSPMHDPQIDKLIQQGHLAIEQNNFNMLQHIVIKLYEFISPAGGGTEEPPDGTGDTLK